MPLIERIISLTGVGSRGGRTGAAWKNGGKRLLPLFLVLPLAGCASGYSPRTMFDDYNYVVGTQTFGSKYQFTDEPRLVETAREIHGLGSNIIKFRLEPTFAEDNYSGPNPGKYNSLKELASRDEAIRTVLGMPFSYYFLWVTPMQPCRWQDEDGYTGEDAEVEYREIYELTRHLLQTYAGTGKTFYLGNWEGDWMLLQGFDRTKDPDPRNVREMIKWVNNRQRAIDAAKRDTPHSNVAVYHYLELVLVERGIRGRSASQPYPWLPAGPFETTRFFGALRGGEIFCLGETGGGGGIRTHGTRKGTTVFETAPIDHSGTPPLPARHLQGRGRAARTVAEGTRARKAAALGLRRTAFWTWGRVFGRDRGPPSVLAEGPMAAQRTADVANGGPAKAGWRPSAW